VAGNLPRCWPVCWPTVLLAWNKPSCSSFCPSVTLLEEQDPGDNRSLAAKADRLWATHIPQSHNLVANVDQANKQLAQLLQSKGRIHAGKKFGGMAFGRRLWPGDGGFWFWLWFRVGWRNLSSLKRVLASPTSTGPMGLRPTRVWPPAHG
jgi:hypothetical protein